jgi:predicted acetyltransferase
LDYLKYMIPYYHNEWRFVEGELLLRIYAKWIKAAALRSLLDLGHKGYDGEESEREKGWNDLMLKIRDKYEELARGET